VYAVGHLLEKVSKIGSQSIGVAGGTAWGCQMFVLRRLKEWGSNTIQTALPLYFFDQTAQKWYQCSVGKQQVTWIVMDQLPPRPSGIYAGIGSSELTKTSEAAILRVFEQE
jgi:hypothetical protein